MIDKNRAIKYCKDDISLIENYDKAIADKTQIWHCHHRRETIYSVKDLQDIGEYYNRPACELIFLTPVDHRRLHNLGKPSGMKGKHQSEESRKKISEANKGENNPRFGKHHSAEARKKISEANKGENNPMFGKPPWNKGKQHSAEARKKMSESKKGKHHSAETLKRMSEAHKCKHHSEETRKKISDVTKGTHWYNNGVKCIKAKTCPEGFVQGRLKR